MIKRRAGTHEPRRPALPPLSERAHSVRLGPWHVIVLDTPIQSVVSFQGSFCTYPDFAAGEIVLQELVVALLDKGTHRRDRFQIAEELENRGAQLSFSSDGLRVRFSGRALPEDLDMVMEIVAEQLREPRIGADEFDKARAYVAASLRREMESTGAQAGAALSRLMYPRTHPNFSMQPEEAMAALRSYSVEQVRAFHQEHFSPARGVVVVVGDLRSVAVDEIVGRSLSDWVESEGEIDVAAAAMEYEANRATVPLAEKANSDVRLGHPLRLLRSDEDFIPLYVGNYVLGGNFSGRLMTIIRDRMGLTYGIWSNLGGVTTDYSGHWAAGITLSKDNVERGTEATRTEMKRFVLEGIESAELEDAQTTIAGAFQVGLATTGGLASTLLQNAERGFDVAYLDRFPEMVRSLHVDRVNDVLRRHLDPDRLSLAICGELPA